jgi:XTP/dITP diphosphohydrolase
MTRLVLATRNTHKVIELQRILAGELPTGGQAHISAIEIVGLDAYPDAPEVPETGITFADNALLKARAIAAATGCPAVADDSGLCVDVLGGAPGIFSARWSGRHGDDQANLQLLLAQLADIADEQRTAHFACAAAVALPTGPEWVVEGRLGGRLTHEPRGSHGFGYDPIFVPEGHDVTTAELEPADKDAISHRGRAFRALAPELLRMLAAEPVN